MTHQEEKLIIVCRSNNEMLKAENLLRIAVIENDLVPTPSHLGSICSTSIAIAAHHREAAAKVLNQAGILHEMHPYRAKRLMGLLRSLGHTPLSDGFLQGMKALEQGEDLTKETIVALLKSETKEELALLFDAADRMRKEIIGDQVEIRAAIEFSNICRKHCDYCGISGNVQGLRRYRMTEDEIMEAVHGIHALGIKTVILQSGEDEAYTPEVLESLIRRIKRETKMGITLSIGERSREVYQRLKEAGANNFLLKIETTNPKLFQQLHPDDDFEHRKQCAQWLKELGYVMASGNMVGLPGQSLEDLASDILYFKEMGIHMIGIGPFLPAKGTPLANYPPGDVLLTLKTLAVTRLVCKNVYLPATTALATADPEGQVKALKAGANSLMLISTPLKYREGYQLYSNKTMIDLEGAVKAIREAGRELPSYLKYKEGKP